MATKAYFLISMAKEFCQCPDDYQEAMEGLKAIPEVKSIEPVSGPCDLLVQVEAPIRVIFVADKILAKKWVKRLHILKVQPFQFNVSSKVIAQERLKAQIALAREAKT